MHRNVSRTLYLVTPTLNSEAFIAKTLGSIFSQEGDFFLYLHIQDGGSTDDTLKIVQEMSEQADPQRFRVTMAQAKDSGMYDAIDKGFAALSMSDESPMGWLNSGDLLLPGCLSATANVFDTLSQVEWLGSPYVCRFDDAAGFLVCSECYFPQDILRKGLADGAHWPFLQQEGLFWRKRLYDQAGGVNTRLKYAGDWDLWVRFANLAPLYHSDAPRACFRLHAQQLSGNSEGYSAELESIRPAFLSGEEADDIVKNGNLRSFQLVWDNQRGSIHVLDAHIESKEARFWDWTKIGSRWQQSRAEEHGLASDLLFKIGELEKEKEKLVHALTQFNEKPSLLERLVWNNPILHRIYRVLPIRLQRVATTLKYRFFLHGLERISYYRTFLTIKRSGLFFPKYYLDENPDVAADDKMGALEHFIRHGANEGRSPNPFFSVTYYTENNTDVVLSRVNPLVHYIKFGQREGRMTATPHSKS